MSTQVHRQRLMRLEAQIPHAERVTEIHLVDAVTGEVGGILYVNPPVAQPLPNAQEGQP